MEINLNNMPFALLNINANLKCKIYHINKQNIMI